MTRVLSLAAAFSFGSLSLFSASCSDDPVTILASTGDAGSDEGTASDADAETTVDATTDAPTADADPLEDVAVELTVSDEDFLCLTEWEGVRGFFLTNLLGDTAEAIRIAEGGFEEPAPVGTVIQLIPLEAMVKLAPGSSSATNDWEYFILQNTTEGSTITSRGFEDISNIAGTCNSCHSGAVERDFVCEDTGLCAAGALPRDLVDSMVENDPRCD